MSAQYFSAGRYGQSFASSAKHKPWRAIANAIEQPTRANWVGFSDLTQEAPAAFLDHVLVVRKKCNCETPYFGEEHSAPAALNQADASGAA
jgi:hypothetical protein